MLRALISVGISLALPVSAALAEPCAPRETIWLWGPKSGARVPPSIRFRVYIGTGCSEIPEGPPSEFRLLDGKDREITIRRDHWGGYTEFVPAVSLPPGPYRFEWRHAIDLKALGPWSAMTQVTVGGEPDRKPPDLVGRVEISPRPIWGTNALSPCTVEQGWELETILRFQPAVDAASGPEDLLYALVRRGGPRGELRLTRSFRPERAGTLVSYSFKESFGCWAKTWEYHLCVRDPSGNYACSPHVTTVTTPPEPPRPKGAPPSLVHF